MFHDVNFPSCRPSDAVGFGHHPDSRPDALHAIESGANFYVAVLELEGFQRVHSSAGIGLGWGGLIGLGGVVSVFSPQGHGGIAVLFPEFHKAFVLGLVFAPIRGVMVYVIDTAPVAGIQGGAVKVVFKNKFPVFAGDPRGCRQGRRPGKGNDGEKKKERCSDGHNREGWDRRKRRQWPRTGPAARISCKGAFPRWRGRAPFLHRGMPL